MAASFTRASAMSLRNTAPAVVTVPITVGLWVYPFTTTPQSAIWSLGDATVLGGTGFFLSLSHTTAWLITSAIGGSADNATGGTVTANAWAFLCARFVAVDNRKLDVLQKDGSTAALSSTVSKAIGTVNQEWIGSRVGTSSNQAFDGLIGEFWWTNTDIQGDGAALQTALLRQLAYGGPFSVPHIAKDIIEYRSFRVFPDSRGDQAGEVYHGGFGRQIWTNTNGVTTGPHPPLPYWYVKPGQAKHQLVI